MLKRLYPILFALLTMVVVIAFVFITYTPSPIMPTVAAFPSDTPPPSSTPEPSDTPAPTVTPSLDDHLYKIVDDSIALPILQAETNPTVPSVLIRFEMLENNLTVALYQLEKLFCPVRESGLFEGYNYLIRARGQFVDQFGNPVDEDGLSILLLPEAIQKVNCDNISSVNWQLIAESYSVHRLISD